MCLTADSISTYLQSNFQGLNIINTWGEKAFFYNPANLLKRGLYFCTLKEKDGNNDKASNLNRAGIFRINFGLPKKTFLNTFQILPKRPAKGTIIEGPYDFTQLDTLTPHPVYGWMSWVSILNPSATAWPQLEALLTESYQLCLQKYDAKKLSQIV